MRFNIKIYSVNDFREWYERGELILSPKFQRRRVWAQKAKSYLIDTILRGMPISPIFIREKIDTETKKTIREVVDGQQRLAAIIDYLHDGFTVSKIHNEKYGNLYFSQLPEDTQEEFLQYSITANVVIAPRDEEILEIFARLNTYTVPLNLPEKLNAKFFGLFKQTVHKLARDFHTFWLDKKILSEQKITRMIDVELTSELVIASIDGIKGKDKKIIEKYYKIYDEVFENKNIIEENFSKCIDTIGEIYGDKLSESVFKGMPLFYSLYCLIYDLLFGLPNSGNELRIERTHYVKIRNALEELESRLEENLESQDIKQFKEDYQRHTTVENTRKRRHEFLLNFIKRYL